MCRYPFNYDTILEFVLTHIFYSAPMAFIYLFITITVLTFFMNCCALIDAGCSHIQSIYNEIEYLALHRSEKRAQQTTENIKQVVEMHTKIIGFVGRIKIYFTTELFFLFRLFQKILF